MLYIAVLLQAVHTTHSVVSSIITEIINLKSIHEPDALLRLRVGVSRAKSNMG